MGGLRKGSAHIDCCVIVLVEVMRHCQADPVLPVRGLQMQQSLSSLDVSGIFSKLDLRAQKKISCRQFTGRFCADYTEDNAGEEAETSIHQKEIVELQHAQLHRCDWQYI